MNNHNDGTIAGAQLCDQPVPSMMPSDPMQQFNVNVANEMDQLSPSQQEQYLQYVQYMQQMQQHYTMQGMQHSQSSQSMQIQQQLQQWSQMDAAQQYQYYQQLQQYQQYQQQLQSQQCQHQMGNAQPAGAQTPSVFPNLYNFSSERSYAANNDHVRSRTASPATMLHYVQEFQPNAATKHIVPNQDGVDSNHRVNEHGASLQTTDYQTTRTVPFISIDLHRFSFCVEMLCFSNFSNFGILEILGFWLDSICISISILNMTPFIVVYPHSIL